MSLIAVVDDDAANRVALKALLEAYGHRVHAFDACDHLIDALMGGRRYHAIIMDMWMPGPSRGGHGMKCYYRVRDISPAQAERVIFVSGGGLPYEQQAFLDKHDYLEKPIVWRELEEALERLPKGT